MVQLSRYRRYLPWNWSTKKWLFALSTTIVLSPFLFRSICLLQVPDVELSSTTETMLSPFVPSSANAWPAYRLALAKLQKLEAELPQTLDEAEVDNSEIDLSRMIQPGLDDRSYRSTHWLIGDELSKAWEQQDLLLEKVFTDHSSIFNDVRRASAEPEMQFIPLKYLDHRTNMVPFLNCYYMGNLIDLWTVRKIQLGQIEEAFDWAFVVFRMGRHIESNQHSMAVLCGWSLKNLACRRMISASEGATLTADKLRRFRTELNELSRLHVTSTQTAKAEYLRRINIIRHPDFLGGWMPTRGKSKFDPSLTALKRGVLFFIGQPELSERFARQFLVNQLDAFDKPFYQRDLSLSVSEEGVLANDPNSPLRPGQWSSAVLTQKAKSGVGQLFDSNQIVAKTLVWAEVEAEVWICIAKLALAVQEYQRVERQWPESLQLLVPDYLEAIPEDLYAERNSLLRYQIDSDGSARIWSIGRDRIDQLGDIDADGKRQPLDVGTRVFSPRAEVEENLD